MDKIMVGIDERGRRVGESHPRARLTNDQVDWLRDLYDTGMVGYRTLARAANWLWGIEVSRNTVSKLVKYERRNATVMSYKAVYMTE